ncbi:hypothetical protein ETB97_001567 [Aspergillus alliaceus]|uniref:AB hydrolase-1 domain-containing protein n=1 Tax=Petromyces alliaceus TaxID=209559 RepID=A0A8H6ADW3_PETAA|nr:hypothetical protein ETB97_001567 [Aspergillus burnettii]
MASESPFAVVICHGSYHTPAPYQPLLDALAARGVEAYCPQRPTCDLSRLNVGDVNNPDFDREPPVGGYPTAADDAASVGELLDRLIVEGKSILLVGHSSGGWVAAEAAQRERHAKTRTSNGETGGIIGLFFIGALVIPIGESVSSFFQPRDGNVVVPPFMRFHENGLGVMVDLAKYLFSDAGEGAASEWAQSMTAAPNMTSPLTHDPYDLPCAYVILDRDMCLPKEVQQSMIDLQNKKNPRPFTVYHAPCGHSPHITWTEGLAQVIEKFCSGILQ